MHDPSSGSTPTVDEAEISPQKFRTILSRFATGVVAITALGTDEQPVGIAINSFTSVSLDPPLAAFCIAHTSRSWPRIRAAGRHCLNILGDNQRAVSAQLASQRTDKFDGVHWSPSCSGMPILTSSLGWLVCSVEAEHPAGDHLIIVVRIHHATLGDEHPPLVFFGSEYRTIDVI